MIILCFVVGVLLAAIGLGGYIATGMEHPTALIPFVIGDLFITIGVLVKLRPTWRMHLMHAAATLALLGTLGTINGLLSGYRWLQGTVPARPAAVLAQSATAIILALFVGLAVRSFIQARIQREAEAAKAASK